jgi:hypothetical protein
MHIEVKARFDRVLLIEGSTFMLYAAVAMIYSRQLFDLHGITLNDTGVFMTQMSGAVFFAFSALNLMARQLTDTKALHLIVNVNLIKHVVALIVCAGNFMTGALHDSGGLGFILLFGLFSIIFGYFHLSSAEYVNAEYLAFKQGQVDQAHATTNSIGN